MRFSFEALFNQLERDYGIIVALMLVIVAFVLTVFIGSYLFFITDGLIMIPAAIFAGFMILNSYRRMEK